MRGHPTPHVPSSTIVFAVVTAALFVAASAAQAQEAQDTLPLERFRTPIDHHGFGTTEGGAIPDHLELEVGYVANYALNPLVLRDAAGNRVAAIVGHRLAGDLLFTIGLFDYVSLGLDLPMTLLQLSGADTPEDLRGALGLSNGISSIGLGDLKVVPKIRILREDRHYVSLSLSPTFTLPTASGVNFTNGIAFDYGGSYLGEGPLTFTFQPEAAISTNLFGLRAAANLQWRLRPTYLYLGTIPVGPDLAYRLGLGYDVAWLLRSLDVNVPLPSLLFYGELFGATSDRNPFGLIQDPSLSEREQRRREQEVKLANTLEWTAGVRWHIWQGIHVEAGFGSGLVNGFGSPDARVYGGVRYALESDDQDRDGIDDADDKCPTDPEDKDQFEDSDGCAELDNDVDGLPDEADACPNEAEDVDGFDDLDGCPEADNDKDGVLDAADRCPDEAGLVELEGCPILDQDRDGITDVDDACPTEPGPLERKGCPVHDRDQDGVEDGEDKCPDEKGPAERQGCPIPDKDGDGVEDQEDQCPTEPGPRVLQGCPDKDGDGVADKDDKCPDVPGFAVFEGCGDKDKDAIPDHKDQCPDEPETINGVNDEDGCPDKGKVVVVVTKEKVEIKETIYFDTGKSTIQTRSHSLLNQVAQVLNANQQIKKVSIEGHTDSQGRDESNKRLSQDRADSVKSYLIGKNVEPARLDSKGFGEEKPVDTNKSAAGRANNRRVEFVIVEQD